MASSSLGSMFTTIGVCWPGAVLMVLFASVAFHQMRDFVGSLTIVTHLTLWFVAMIPGVVLVFLGERMRRE